MPSAPALSIVRESTSFVLQGMSTMKNFRDEPLHSDEVVAPVRSGAERDLGVIPAIQIPKRFEQNVVR